MPRYQRSAPEPRVGHPRPNQGVWTALSRPPFFSALAIWPCFGHWTGGGFFLSEREIVLNEPADALTPQANAGPPPAGYRFRPIRDVHDGHSLTVSAPSAHHPSLIDPEMRDRAFAALRAAGRRWIDWMLPLPCGVFLAAADGRLFRCDGGADRTPEQAVAGLREVADLRGWRFERRPPTAEAMRW